MNAHEQIESLVLAAVLLGVGLALTLVGLVMLAYGVNRRK